MTTYILIVMIPGAEPARVNCRNTSETVAAIREKQQNHLITHMIVVIDDWSKQVEFVSASAFLKHHGTT